MKGYDSRQDTLKHISEVKGLLVRMAYELLQRGRQHDASKLVDPEKPMFDEFTPKLSGSTYGSEEYEGFRKAMGPALQHHYDKNDHHPEHFKNGIADMNLIQITEMLCDWVAASKRHDDGDIRDSIEKNQKRFGFSDEIKHLLLNTVDVVT